MIVSHGLIHLPHSHGLRNVSPEGGDESGTAEPGTEGAEPATAAEANAEGMSWGGLVDY